jgi:sec-independent protein translocase protein TatA
MLALAAPSLSSQPSHEGLFMFGIGNTELIVVAVVALILFGHRLPNTMFSLGQGFRKLKEGLNSTSTEDVT